jgi:hypothetical protein
MRRRKELERLLIDAKAGDDRPRYLRLVAEILIHDHAAVVGERCPCCGSTTAEIVERRPEDDLVIDLLTGERLRAKDMSAETWSSLCAIAAQRDCPLPVSRAQARLVLDDSGRHLFASGGNRSSKTTAGLIWLFLQWLRYGGPRRRFWLVASKTEKAFELLEKFRVGDGDTRGLIPPELIVRRPASHRASNLQTVLADGSLIELKPFIADPGAERLKSDKIVAALVTEAAHMPGKPSLTALEGRCLDLHGRLFLDSTPMPETFLLEDVVKPAMEFERLPPDDPRRATRAHKGAGWLFVALAVLANPWLDKAEVEAKLSGMDQADPSVRRDMFGEWVSNSGFLWRDYSAEKHQLAHEARDFKALGPVILADLGVSDHIPITDRVVRHIFGRPSPHFRGMRATNQRYFGGMDVNFHPITALFLQVTAPKDSKPDDRDSWHFWVFEQVYITYGSTYELAEKINSTIFGRVLEPDARSSPFAGCGIVGDATSISRDHTVTKYGRDPVGCADVFGPKQIDVRAPLYNTNERGVLRGRNPNTFDSHLLTHRLLREGRLHISQRCDKLIDAFMQQEDDGGGVEPIKVSGTRSDRISSPMDALRYALWAALHTTSSTIRLATG